MKPVPVKVKVYALTVVFDDDASLGLDAYAI